MYPVSEAYKKAITEDVRDVKVTGTITLKDDTIINVADKDMVQGSLYISEQCVSGQDIEVGNVYAAEMGLELTVPLENPYLLDGARIALNYGIDVGGIWEYVPLGYFYVTEIERKFASVRLTALDAMLLFDVPCGTPGPDTPAGFAFYACTVAGVPLVGAAAMSGYANAASMVGEPGEKIKTCRDLLMWACQLMGAFARINRQGQLEIIPVTGRMPVRTIHKSERYKTNISDFVVKITKVSMEVGEKYSSGVSGMELVLEENSLLEELSAQQIESILNNIREQIATAVYVPIDMDHMGDPALQPGDFLILWDAGLLEEEEEEETYFLSAEAPLKSSVNVAITMITHSTWRYRGGAHNIRAVGKSAITRGIRQQQEKAMSTISVLAKTASDIALAANQSTQLIKDAIGGHVLIRQNPDETNEILIMDHPEPEQATKIWRWNMGGLGYSDNCIGADNPAREYEVAMTMDGAINANFIKAGIIDSSFIRIGPDTEFDPGYAPEDTRVYFQYSADGATNWHDTFNPATDHYMRQKVGIDGTWTDPARIAAVDGKDGQDGHTPVKGTDYFDGIDGQDGKDSYLWVRYSQNASGSGMTTDPTNARYIGVSTTNTPAAPTSYTSYSWSLIKGTDGVPGEVGEDGQTSYLHIKYSNNGTTFTSNNGETVGSWIGTYVDFTEADSTTFSKYTWNKVRGDDGSPGSPGQPGQDGRPGADGADGKSVNIFTVTPYPPYKVGDLWVKSDDSTFVCITAKLSGTYSAAHWRDVSKNKFDAPGYVTSTNEGIKVFDASNNLRVLMGSWLAGIRKYGIKIIDGEIYSSLFQTGAENATTFIRLDTDGNFSAYNYGDRIVFIQSNTHEGRIRLGDAVVGNAQKMSMLAAYTALSQSMSGVIGESGLVLRGVPSGTAMLALTSTGSIEAVLASGRTFYVTGNYSVSGSKSALVTTETHGQRLLYSYETPESKFMDEGVAELSNGTCRIDIDPIFLETIEPNSTETPFIVHLTPYDFLTLRVAEIGDSYFIAEEKDGLDGRFSWQLSATRLEYAGKRLPAIDEDDILASGWEDEYDEFAEED